MTIALCLCACVCLCVCLSLFVSVCIICVCVCMYIITIDQQNVRGCKLLTWQACTLSQLSWAIVLKLVIFKKGDLTCNMICCTSVDLDLWNIVAEVSLVSLQRQNQT